MWEKFKKSIKEDINSAIMNLIKQKVQKGGKAQEK